MKIFKRIFFIMSFTLTLLHGQEVTEQTAIQAGLSWIEKNKNTLNNFTISGISELNIDDIKITPIHSSNNQKIVYILSIEQEGFIIIATDFRINPVLGFSFENDFDLNFNVNNIFMTLVKQDVSLRLQKLEEGYFDANVITKNKIRWNSLIDFYPANKNMKTPVDTVKGPFLLSDWGQANVHGQPHYNYFTPNNWPAGCVATGLAQILNYYKWPMKGMGSHSYFEDDAGTLSANFGETNYDWQNTLDQYENVLPTFAQRTAAGLLTYHCAVALNMDFEQNGSTASTSFADNVLKNYFRFSGHYKSATSSGFWTELKNNMLDERPVLIAISGSSVGHAIVVDGYFSSNGYYHINPGWYGSQNGWYDLSGSWNMSGYSIVNGGVKGIVPSPMINEIAQIDSLTFDLSWSTSRFQKADFYQLQQALQPSGPWTTISSEIADTVFRINLEDIRSYYYRVRANRAGIWWDYSSVKKVEIGGDREITFRVNMSDFPLEAGDIVVVRGNIEPLSGMINSDPFEGPDEDGVFSLAVNFNLDHVGETLLFRFMVDKGNELISESVTREYVIGYDLQQFLPIAQFDQTTDINIGNDEIIYHYNLSQNYPNPFNPATNIRFSIPHAEQVTFQIFNSIGEEINSLRFSQYFVNQNNSVSINFSEIQHSSGLYFLKMTTEKFSKTIKMLYLK